MTRKQHRLSPSKPQPPCDVLILYHHDDHTAAQNLQETVHSLAPNASCRVLTPQRVPLETDVSLFSVQVWLLVSECAVCDSLMMFYKDELIMKSIKSGRNQFLPVFSKPKDLFISLPYSLAAYTGLTLTNSNLNRVISRMLNSTNHQEHKDQLTAEYNRHCLEWAKCEKPAYEEITSPNTENAVCSSDQNHEDHVNIREEPANQQQRNVFNITVNGNPQIHCQDGFNGTTAEATTKPSEAKPRHKVTTKHNDTSKTPVKDTQRQEETGYKDIPVEEKVDTKSLQSVSIPPKKQRWDNVTAPNDDTEWLDNDDDDTLSLHSISESNSVEEGNKNKRRNGRINVEDLFEGVESESQRTSSGRKGRNIVCNVVLNHPKVVNIGNYH